MKYLIAVIIIVLILIQAAKGQTWITQNSGTTVTLSDIFFTDINTGWAVGWQAGNVILKTTNSGINWFTQTIPSGADSPKDIYMLNSTTGFISTRSGQVLKTTDGGNLWTISLNNPGSDYLAITFANDLTGYTVGGGGVIYKTTNAGAGWFMQTSGQSSFLYDVCFTAPDTGYVTAYLGTMLYTFNGGANWNSVLIDAGTQIVPVLFINSNTGYTAGSSQTVIYKTTNKGLNWNFISTDFGGGLKSDMHFTDANTGFITSSDGAVRKTTNGGLNWVSQTTITGGALGIYFVNQTTGFAVGFSGKIIKTSDQPLPVELSYFSGSVSGNFITLKWGTGWELNNSKFEIERKSVSGNNSDWIKLGEVSGRGTINIPCEYTFTDKTTGSGEYNYRLKQIDLNGNYEYFNLTNSVTVGKPLSFEVKQNYPNPSNPQSIIEFKLPVYGYVNVKVYDPAGREVMVLMDGNYSADYYQINFNGSDLSSGVYFYRVWAKSNEIEFSEIKKLILVK